MLLLEGMPTDVVVGFQVHVLHVNIVDDHRLPYGTRLNMASGRSFDGEPKVLDACVDLLLGGLELGEIPVVKAGDGGQGEADHAALDVPVAAGLDIPEHVAEGGLEPAQRRRRPLVFGRSRQVPRQDLLVDLDAFREVLALGLDLGRCALEPCHEFQRLQARGRQGDDARLDDHLDSRTPESWPVGKLFGGWDRSGIQPG